MLGNELVAAKMGPQSGPDALCRPLKMYETNSDKLHTLLQIIDSSAFYYGLTTSDSLISVSISYTMRYVHCLRRIHNVPERRSGRYVWRISLVNL